MLGFFLIAFLSCTFCALALGFVYFSMFSHFFLVLFTLLLVYFIQQCFCFFLFSIFVYSFIISSFVSSCGDKIKGFLLMLWAETV